MFYHVISRILYVKRYVHFEILSRHFLRLYKGIFPVAILNDLKGKMEKR